jgi:serine carboxypeptidase-like clade 2
VTSLKQVKFFSKSGGDQDSVVLVIGSQSLVNGLAKELGLNTFFYKQLGLITNVAYRIWFDERQVNT